MSIVHGVCSGLLLLVHPQCRTNQCMVRQCRLPQMFSAVLVQIFQCNWLAKSLGAHLAHQAGFAESFQGKPNTFDDGLDSLLKLQ